MTKKTKKIVLTPEEQELEDEIAAGDWVFQPSNETEREMLESAARRTMIQQKKESRVNIRMTEHELSLAKLEAKKEGIPYQTFMSSVLHKYLTGQLVDRKVINELTVAFRKAVHD